MSFESAHEQIHDSPTHLTPTHAVCIGARVDAPLWTESRARMEARLGPQGLYSLNQLVRVESCTDLGLRCALRVVATFSA